MVTIYPSTPDGWKRYYDGLHSLSIDCEGSPHFEEVEKRNDEHYIRNSVVDISKANNDSLTAFVCCDVAVLPPNALIDLSATGSFLVVFARTVSTEDDACAIRVKINPRCMSILRLHILQVSQVLTVTFTGDGEPQKHPLNPKSNAISVEFRCDGQVVRSDMHDSESELCRQLLKKPMNRRFVKSQLRIAAFASCSLPSLSTHILAFLRRFIHLLPQAECDHTPSLVQQVDRGNGIGNRNSISPLSLATCGASVEQSLHAACSFRTKYELFVDKDNPTQQIEAAQSAVARIDKLIEEQEAVAKEEENQRKNAESAQRRAYFDLWASKEHVVKVETDFKTNLEEWVKNQSRDIKLKAVLACIGLLTSVAAIALGSGAGIPALPSLLKQASTVGDMLDKLHEAEVRHADLTTTVKVFTELHGAIMDLHTEATATSEGCKEVSNRKRDLDPERRNAITAWQIFGLDLSARLQLAISQGVPSANSYHAVINKHVEFEKNYCGTTLTLLKARRSEEQAKKRLETLSKDRKQKAQEDLDSFKTKKEAFDKKCADFFDQFLVMRSDIVSRLRVYLDSYRYCTLRDVPPGLNLDVAKPLWHLQTCYSRIKDDHLEFLASHSMPPSSFTKHWMLGNLQPDLAEIKQGLESAEHRFSFVLSDSSPGPFTNMCHVHLSSMEVHLEGARSIEPQASVELQVETNGVYQNMDVTGKWLTLRAEPLHDAVFVYTLNDCDQGQPEMLLEFGEPFSRPTPFTEWTIKLSNPDEVDLSRLTSVQFLWKGSAYKPSR